jgi:hypothetical protein
MATERREQRPGPQPDRQHGRSEQQAADRDRLIAVAAYYIAQQRGFQEGSELDDWLQAEQQLEAEGRIESLAFKGGEKLDKLMHPRMPNRLLDVLEVPDLERRRLPERIEPDEVKAWAKALEVSEERLREAISRVGPMVDDVRRYLSDVTH